MVNIRKPPPTLDIFLTPLPPRSLYVRFESRVLENAFFKKLFTGVFHLL